MWLFSKKEKLYMYNAKDILLTKIKTFDPTVIDDTQNRFYLKIFLKGRIIEISLNCFRKGFITLDVVDSFGFINIPRKAFKYREDFDEFLRTVVIQKLNWTKLKPSLLNI